MLTVNLLQVLPESEGGGKNGTLLKLVYEQRAKARFWREWVFSHPRIVLPIVAALLASAAVAIFDP